MDKKRVMIVEDDLLNRTVFNDVLEGFGYATICCESAEQALSCIHEQKPDVILMDIQMEGISGLELMQCINKDKTLPFIPIFVVSRFTQDDIKKRAMEAGCLAYITKPFDNMEIVNTVEKLLNLPART